MNEIRRRRERLFEARESHQQLVEQEALALQRLAIPRNGDTNDAHQQRLIQARHARLHELQSQREVFETEVARLEELKEMMSREERRARLERELYQFQRRRSVSAKRLEIEAFLSSPARVLVVQAAPESGIITRVPQYVAAALRGRVLCMQRTQRAARDVAKMVAFEWSVGERRSYKGLLETDTRVVLAEGLEIDFVTLRKLVEIVDHGAVDDVCCVVVDGVGPGDDDLISTLRDVSLQWQHLKIIVVASDDSSSSAIIDTLTDALVIEVPTVAFPTSITHESPAGYLRSGKAGCTQLPLTVAMCALRLHEAHSRSDGDILCFLPSEHDALEAKTHFEDALAQAKRWSRDKPKRLRSAQTRVMVPHQEAETLEWLDVQETKQRRRNVIFASENADALGPLDSVGIVVDSGVHYGVRIHSSGSLPSLETISVISVSHSEAQRRARIAGRSRPGVCVRLNADGTENDNPDQCHQEEISPLADELKDPRLVRMVSFGAERSLLRAAIELVVMILVAKRFYHEAFPKEKKAKQSKSARITIENGDEGDIVAMYHAFHRWKKAGEREPEPENESSREQWCIGRGIDPTVMRLAQHFTERLHAIAIGEEEEQSDDTSNMIDTTALRRIIAAGFFANAAVLKPSSRPQAPVEFFSLQTQAVGFVASNRFSTHVKRPLDEGIGVGRRGEWIVYCEDAVCDDGTPCFKFPTPVEEAWILEEAPELASKRLNLPIAAYTWRGLSDELITAVFGVDGEERDTQLALLEQQLACKLIVDATAGMVSAVELPERRVVQVRKDLEFHMENGRKKLTQHANERSYMGSTRAVITSGFQVHELLFHDEFVSLSVCKWQYGVDSLLETIARQSEGLMDPVVQQVEVVGTDIVNVRVDSKYLARKLLERLSNSDAIRGAEVVPLRSATNATPHSIMASQFGGRIKISWAGGVATGRAKLSFADVSAANRFLRSYADVPQLAGVRASPRGVLSKHRIDDDLQLPESWLATLGVACSGDQIELKQQPPPLVQAAGRLLFDEAAIGEMDAEDAAKLELCVEITNGLPLDVDEEELIELAAPAQAIDCVIRRRKGEDGVDSPDQQRRMYSLPLVSCLETNENLVSWEKRKARRVGVIVELSDVLRVEEVCLKAEKSPIWQEIRDDKPFGQPIRLCVEHFSNVKLTNELFECFRESITQILSSAQAKGVKCRQSQDKGDLVMQLLVSRSRQRLRETVDAIEGVVEFEKLDGADVSALFTAPGRLKVDAWLDSQGPTHETKTWTTRAHSGTGLLIYGTKENREKTVEALKELADQIENDVEVLDRIVRVDLSKVQDSSSSGLTPKQSKKLVRYWLLAQPAIQQLYHVRVVGSGGRVALSGSRAQVDTLVAKWSRERRLVERPERSSTDTEDQALPDCGVCTLPVEEPMVQFAVCGHLFCLECIQPGITPSTPLQLKCPSYNCGRRIHVNDVFKVNKNADALVETAVFDYVARHPSECVVCPKSGCNQILSRAKIEWDGEGGQFIHCEICADSYCLACFETTGQAIKRHDDTSCDEFQAGGGTAADRHVQFLRETVLTLRCPQCKAAFLDFSGCTCVQCGNATCGRFFCANCVAFSSTSSGETHDHVRNCEKNPTKGEYFVSERDLAAVHREMRTSQIREYFHSRITNPRVRRNVLQRLTKDLSDLGIIVPMDLIGD